MDILALLQLYTAIAVVISILTRQMVYIDDRSKIVRLENGKIDWGWMIWENSVKTMTGTVAAVLAGMVGVPLTFPDLEVLFICGVVVVVAIVGSDVWDILGTKARKYIQAWSMESIGDDSSNKNRKGRRR